MTILRGCGLLLLGGIEALPLMLLCGTDGLLLAWGNPHTSLILLRHIVASM
jgi:hypothetical protein